jgi:hypothetical protein
MLWTIVAVLLILWLLGFSLHIGGALIHLLLVVGLVVLVINLLSGRRGAFWKKGSDCEYWRLEASGLASGSQPAKRSSKNKLRSENLFTVTKGFSVGKVVAMHVSSKRSLSAFDVRIRLGWIAFWIASVSGAHTPR